MRSFFVILFTVSCFCVKAMEDGGRGSFFPRSQRIKKEQSQRDQGSSIKRSLKLIWEGEKKKKERSKTESVGQTTLKIRKLLSTEEHHLKALDQVFDKAQERIVIASPMVSKEFIQGSLLKLLKLHKEKIKKLTIYTSLAGNDILEPIFKQHFDESYLPELRPMNSCGVYCLIMDSVLFTNGTWPWLDLSMPSKEKRVCLTSTFIGMQAEPFIFQCLKMLDNAIRHERDYSLDSAQGSRLLEIPEAPMPRPRRLEGIPLEEDLDWLKIVNLEDKSGHDHKSS